MEISEFEQQKNELLLYIQQQRQRRHQEDLYLGRIEQYLLEIEEKHFIMDEKKLLYYILASLITNIDASIVITSNDASEKTGISSNRIPVLLQRLHEAGAIDRDKHIGKPTNKAGKRENHCTISLPQLSNVPTQKKRSEVNCPVCSKPGLHFQLIYICNGCNVRAHEEYSLRS